MRWFSSNLWLKLFALVLAAGIVIIKAQEKILPRSLHNIKVVLENVPPNLTLPEHWIDPVVSIQVHGPRTTIEYIRPELSYIRIDLSKVLLQNTSAPVSVVLTGDMFRTNLEEEHLRRLSVDEESILPRQALLRVATWKVGEKKPVHQLPENAASQVEFPLYRIEKDVPVIVPTIGKEPAGVVFKGYSVEPPALSMTGQQEALERIRSVSTMALDLGGVKADTLPIYLPLQNSWQEYDVKPVDPNVRDVTVVLDVSQKR